MSAIASPPSPFIGLSLAHRSAGFRRFTVPEYHQLIRHGILTEDDDLELLDGHLVKKMARNAPHDGTLKKVEKRLLRVLTVGWDTRVQMGLTLAGSEPEPDLLLTRDHPDGYTSRHPVPADVGLVIEVADSTVATDRADKAPLYGHACIPEYWIVNIPDRRVEVFSRPTGPTANPGYATRTDFLPSQSVPLSLGGQFVASIAVDDLLP